MVDWYYNMLPQGQAVQLVRIIKMISQIIWLLHVLPQKALTVKVIW